MSSHIDLAYIEAEAQRERERKRQQIKRTQQRIREDTERRKRQAIAADERQRAEQQAALKREVETFYLYANPAFTRQDFEQAWKDNKERLVRELEQFHNSVPRM